MPVATMGVEGGVSVGGNGVVGERDGGINLQHFLFILFISCGEKFHMFSFNIIPRNKKNTFYLQAKHLIF